MPTAREMALRPLAVLLLAVLSIPAPGRAADAPTGLRAERLFVDGNPVSR